LFGHTLAEYRDLYGDDLRRMQNYQIALYTIIDEQIAAGMRHFASLLRPGAALWMSEYVLMQRLALGHLGLQLHILYTQPALTEADGLAHAVLRGANTTALIRARNEAGQLHKLMERSGRMVIVGRCAGTEDLCACAKSEGIAVFRYAMADLIRGE